MGVENLREISLQRSRKDEARRAFVSGWIATAESVCRESVAGKPYDVGARLLLLRIVASRWLAELAVTQLDLAANDAGGDFKTVMRLSKTLRRLERHGDSLRWARIATDYRPHDAEVHAWLGICLCDAKEFDEAADCLRSALAIESHNASVYNWLGFALSGAGFNDQSISAFQDAVRIEPNSVEYLSNLVEALVCGSAFESALVEADKILELEPHSVVGHRLRSLVLVSLGRGEEAEAEARKTIELDPTSSSNYATLGDILLARGKAADAVLECERSLELEPRQGSAYFTAIRAGRPRAKTLAQLDLLTHLREDETMPDSERSLLAYALGKTYEELGRFGDSIREYEIANLLAYKTKFGRRPCDMDANLQTYNSIKGRYSRDLIAESGRVGLEVRTPIFIVGMIRSGTTLLEQIISSHPDVAASGEQRFWPVNRLKPFDSEGKLDGDMFRPWGALASSQRLTSSTSNY